MDIIDEHFKLDGFTDEELEYAAEQVARMLRGSEEMMAKPRADEVMELLKKQELIGTRNEYRIEYENVFVGQDILAWIGDYRLKKGKG